MSSLASVFARTLAEFRQAAAHTDAARRALTGSPATPAPPDPASHAVTHRLAAVAADLAPGWLGADLREVPDERLGEWMSLDEPLPVRVGSAGTDRTGFFPALVPLLGGAHLAFDTDARDPRVAGLLRGLIVRLLAAAPAGLVRVAVADPAALGATFVPLRPLLDAALIEPVATSADAIRRTLDDAAAHAGASRTSVGDGSWLLLVVASLQGGQIDLNALAALTHAGTGARVCVVVAGWPSTQSLIAPPTLGGATVITVTPTECRIGDPDAFAFSAVGTGLCVPVALDPEPSPAVVAMLADSLHRQVSRQSVVAFTELIPDTLWTQTSADGLRTVIGRAGRTPVELAFDDATPHWLVGGRTGGGKTVFLMDVLYGLAMRYPPTELALYLLDFKEGISFTEFTPTTRDPSFVPHARVVGVESDREFGVAVLRELRAEMHRRAEAMKRAGVTRLSDLRRVSDEPMPRVVAVIDEFQVLFDRGDAAGREAVTLLEDLARKGRSYGIHLVLASQTVAGVEALYGKRESIFGQFPVRIALPGGSDVLDALNSAADPLTTGTAIVNTAAGAATANIIVRFPDAHTDPAVVGVRHTLWERRAPGAEPPTVFAGFATRFIDDDPVFQTLTAGARCPVALVGRTVDVGQTTAHVSLDATPGRHLAVVGTSPSGADILYAAAVSLARQHAPASVRFVVAPLAATVRPASTATIAALAAAGHEPTVVDAPGLRDELRRLAAGTEEPRRTYLIVFGVDAANAVLSVRDPATFRSGVEDLQAVLRNGPSRDVHVLGWWHSLRRLSDDVGGSGNREDVSCLVALNVAGADLGVYLGEAHLAYQPRANRALLVDRHDQRIDLIVPFARPGRPAGQEAA